MVFENFYDCIVWYEGNTMCRKRHGCFSYFSHFFALFLQPDSHWQQPSDKTFQLLPCCQLNSGKTISASILAFQSIWLLLCTLVLCDAMLLYIMNMNIPYYSTGFKGISLWRVLHFRTLLFSVFPPGIVTKPCQCKCFFEKIDMLFSHVWMPQYEYQNLQRFSLGWAKIFGTSIPFKTVRTTSGSSFSRSGSLTNWGF